MIKTGFYTKWAAHPALAAARLPPTPPHVWVGFPVQAAFGTPSLYTTSSFHHAAACLLHSLPGPCS